MKRQNAKSLNRRSLFLLLGLFTLLLTSTLLLMQFVKASAYQQQLITSTVTPTQTPAVTPTPIYSPTIITPEIPPLFGKDWWKEFFDELTNVDAWAEALVGVVLTVLLVILQSLIAVIYKYLKGEVPSFVSYIDKKIPLSIKENLGNTWKSIKNWVTTPAKTIASISAFVENTFKFILISLSSFFIALLLVIVFIFRKLSDKIKEPKWYKRKGAIDPGLIEVSLAVTAVIVALPGFGTQNSDLNSGAGFNLIRIAADVVSIFVSVSLVDLYAKDKGSKSPHVLLGIFDDGPFFFLSWAILFGFLLISAFTIGVFGSR